MPPILELEGITKAYEGFNLEPLTFALQRGYIMGLIGPNGAGKTTVIKLLLGLTRPDSGRIRIFGYDPRTEGVAIRARIGFVHEDPVFPEGLTAGRAAAALGPIYPHWDGGEFAALAREFEIPLDRRLKALSRGTRTRFALALALSHGAELLLLDEPSSGLDPLFRRDLLDRLAGVIQEGKASVLFSSHLTSDLDRVADYITFLQEGRLRFSLSKEELRERHFLVKGDPALLTPERRRLFTGLVRGDFAFTGLTGDLPAVRRALAGAELVVERATLEDLVFYTGRWQKGGLKLHDRPD